MTLDVSAMTQSSNEPSRASGSPLDQGEIRGALQMVRSVLGDTMFGRSQMPRIACYESVDTLLKLPDQVGVLTLATVLRDTALSFMNESEHWGKAELAMWLMGPYTHCTRLGLARREAALDAPMLLREIDASFVDRIVGIARTSVLDVFRGELASKNVGAFAFEMVEAGFVTRCADARGQDGWLPTTSPRCLAERVLSLFAADYLIRPAAFETELSVCHACRSVEFGICRRHQSGVVGQNGVGRTGRRALPRGPLSSGSGSGSGGAA